MVVHIIEVYMLLLQTCGYLQNLNQKMEEKNHMSQELLLKYIDVWTAMCVKTVQ